MSLVINTNTSASVASATLAATQRDLSATFNRLSSGSRITKPSDDAGGLAVSMKMQSAIKRTAVVQSNIGNALSFLETQDGALATTAKILNRMSELKTMYGDATKSDSDKDNYNTEFTALQTQLTNLAAGTFNGVSLFGGTTLSVSITEDGAKSISIDQSGLLGADGIKLAAVDLTDATLNTNKPIADATMTIANIIKAIENVATLRAANGAQSSQLMFANEMLTINKTNLEASNSRIIDTDIAKESTNLSRLQILSQAGTAMLAQANQSSQLALQLLR